MDSTTTTSSYAAAFQLIPSILSSHRFKPPSVAFNSSLFAKPSSSSSSKGGLCSAIDGQRRISSVESHFCYDKGIPEQRIEKPVGLSLVQKEIGDEPRCGDCQAKGAVLCATCAGTGLYVDSILECQGILLKVRCLGCGGTGNIMCSECGGRGHL